jgi:Domain of unknown function (DUF4781)
MSGVAGTEGNSAHRQTRDQRDTAAPKGKAPAAPTGPRIASSTPQAQDPSSQDRPSCGIAGMGSADPVRHLPDLPPAETSFSSADASASCRAEDPAPARPAVSASNANAKSEQLNSRLSRCRTADDFVALLNELTDPEQQRFVVDRALIRFTDLDSIDDLAIQGSLGLRIIVAQQLLKYAAHPETLQSGYGRGSPQLRKEFASRCAAGVLVALPQNELGKFLASQSQNDGAGFALALGGEHSWRNLSSMPELAKLHARTAGLIDRVLVALNNTPATATTGTIVQNLCLQILPTDFVRSGASLKPPLSSANVATAIANFWYPGDPAQAALAAEDLKDLLASQQGARLMFEGPSLWRMQLIFDVVRRECITSQTFANYDGDPMRHPAVTAALARKLVSMVNGVTVPTPEQAADAEDAARRISGILKTDAGEKLISGPAPVKAKLEAWAAIARDKRITAKTFTSENPFVNRLLTDRIAPLYAAAGAPQEFPGNSLRNMVGLAMGLTPTLPKDAHVTPADLIALSRALAQGKGLNELPPALAFLVVQSSLFANDAAVDKIVEKFNERANTKPPRGAFEFNVLFTELGPIRCPAFRVQVADFDPQTGGPKYEYIDNTGRNYPGGADQTSRDDFLNNKRFPAGVLYHTPHNSFATRDENGLEELARKDTAAANSRVEDFIDKGALVGCFAGGIVALVFSGGTLALAAGVVGGAGAGWDTYRGYQSLKDRAAHGQSNNPFAPGEEGREALLLEVGMLASAANSGAFLAAGGFLGLRAVGAISHDAQWASPTLRAVNTGAAGANITALTVGAADLNENADKMTKEERQRAGVMMVLSSVLAAKSLGALHASPAASTLPPAPQPTGPMPQRPAPLPPAIAGTGGQNQNLGAVPGGHAQNTPVGNATPGAVTNPTMSRSVPAQNMPTGRIGNDNVSPDSAQPAMQQPAQQPIAIAANGSPNYVPTGLDRAQPQAIGHPAPPGSRRPTSVPPAQPTPVSAAPPNRQTAHPRPVRRAGSEPNPSGPSPGAEPTGATAPRSVGTGRDTSFRGSLRTQRPGLWSQLPADLQRSGTDNQIASWLLTNKPVEWAEFVRWLWNNNNDAYAALANELKLPEDRTPATVTTPPENVNSVTGPLNIRHWLDETGLWGFIPERVRQYSNAQISRWIESNRPDLWKQFTDWLGSRLNNVPDEEDTRIIDSPPVLDVRGGRFAHIDAETFVRSFWGSVRRAFPYTDLTLFRERLMISLDRIAGPHKLITVRQFLAAVRESAERELGLNMARALNREVVGRLLLPDESPEVIAGEIDQVRSSSQPGSFGPDDRLRLDGLLNAL